MAETATHRTKTELALQILRDRIRTGALEPGRRLRLNLLTAELGMSPTPIREALRLLQADGLVTYRPHQGIVVAELSEPQTAEVIRLRCLLEGSAVELAVASLASARLRELERLHQRFLGAIEDGRGRDIVGGNEAWHHALYEASESPLLCEFIRRLWDVYPWRTMWVLPGRVEQSAREHEEIMEAARAADPTRAADRMRTHIAGGLISLADDA